jgi:DNA-binding transcriptional LysR family regulator
LFEAIDGVRRPTADCDAVAAHIDAMSRHVEEIGAVRKQRTGPVGRFRLACTNAIAEEVLAPRISQFLLQNQGLTLQLVTSNENLNFSRWEADFAVRLRKPERGDFSVVKLADFALYLFEPADAARQTHEPVICCYPSTLDLTPESQYLAARGLQAAARCVTNNTRLIRRMVENGAVGILPSYVCQGLHADRRLKKTLLPRRRETWLLIQSHLKANRGARVVIEWIRTVFQKAAASA